MTKMLFQLAYARAMIPSLPIQQSFAVCSRQRQSHPYRYDLQSVAVLTPRPTFQTIGAEARTYRRLPTRTALTVPTATPSRRLSALIRWVQYCERMSSRAGKVGVASLHQLCRTDSPPARAHSGLL